MLRSAASAVLKRAVSASSRSPIIGGSISTAPICPRLPSLWYQTPRILFSPRSASSSTPGVGFSARGFAAGAVKSSEEDSDADIDFDEIEEGEDEMTGEDDDAYMDGELDDEDELEEK